MPRPPRNRNYSTMEQPLQAAAASAVGKAQHRDQLFQHMQEIFRNRIEADVIHMVLAECDWEEGQSMDMLLSLCYDCAPQGRETTGPDLAQIACSLIDETKDLEIAGAGLNTSMPLVQESMNITAGKQDLKREMIKSRSYANISPDNNKVNTDSPTDDISLDLINPYLNADVKDITLQSYMSVYLNADSVCPSVPCSSPDMSVLKDEDHTSCDSESLLTECARVNDNRTDCTTDTDSRNVFVHTAVDVVDRELNVGGGNHSRCVTDKTGTDMFSLDNHCRDDPVSGLDKGAVHCDKTNRGCNSPSQNSKGNITFVACWEKPEISLSTFMCTSVSETSESLVEKHTEPDVVPSVFVADARTDSRLCSLETKVMENNACTCSSHINSDHSNCDEDCKRCESGEQPCLPSMKETISGCPADVGSVRDNPECEQCSEKGSNISLAHLSPEAPEFIPCFAKPSSQTHYPSEGSPVFFTPQGPQCRPPRSITPIYPLQLSGFSHLRYRLPLRQYILKPIPVTAVMSQSGAVLGGLSGGAFTSSGTSSGAYTTTCSCTTTTTTTSQALYSCAAMKNGSEPVLTSRAVESKESLATFNTTDEIAWVKRKYLDHGQLLLIILRGLPGSGKSTLARELKFDGAVLNTDEYFMKQGVYKYDINMLSDAHDWNKTRAMKAMQKKINPLIIDNTNLQMWEMIPYVKLALTYKYIIEIVEPSTPWKERPAELAKRNSHGVPKDSIKKMKQRYERNITVKKIIASVKAAEVKEKQKATENVGSQNLKNNDLSFPFQKSSKEPHYPSPPTVNLPTMFSSYTTLLKSRNKGKKNFSTKVKGTSGSNIKTKPTQKQSKVIPSQRDFQSVSEKKMTDVDGKDHEAAAKENTSIVHNEKDFPSGLENPNIGPDEDYSTVCKKPNFGHSQKDCVMSTLEDLLSQGDLQNMTEEDWKRRRDELDVLLQLSPVDPTEKKEILWWLEYRMKQLTVFSNSSESEASTSHLICNNSSSKVQEVKSLRAEDEDDDDVSPVSEPLVTEDYKSAFQKFQMEDNFLNVSSNITNKNDITQLNILGMNNATEEDNELINRTAYNDKPTLESFTQDAFLSFVKDTTVDAINTDTSQYSMNTENSLKTNSKTNLSQINLNSDMKDVKATKQKDIKPPLLDVSSSMDFSENKESMLAKKQEVSDKGIHLIGSAPVKIAGYECCSLSESDTNLNIPCLEADTEKTWSNTSSPVVKECSSVWDDDNGVNSSKPKRVPKKKNHHVVDKHLVKNNETCHLNLNSEISTVPKFENEYWSSNMKNVVSERCSVSDEEIIDWNLDGQKPKPQRERKYSERHSQSSDNTSQDRFNTGSTEEQTEEEPSIEQQNIQSDDNIKTEIAAEDSCDDVGQPSAADSFNVTGVQVNSTDTETFLYNFEPDHVEESYKNGSERLVFSDQENLFESLDSCKTSTEALSTSASVHDVRQEIDACSQESASSNEKLMISSKAETPNDETSDINDDTITSCTELLNASTQETVALGPAEKTPKKSRPKHKLTPFLDSSSKQKYETSNWSTFDPVQNVCSNVTHTEVKANKKVSNRTHWTLTTAKDFNVLDGLNRGSNVSSIKNADQYTILLGKDRSLNQIFPVKSKDTNDCVSEKLHVDKGTMTDDGQNSLESDIEFLKQSFPDTSEHQLWEVLTMCQNDVEWSLNLLLDWGVHVPLTPVDKREIAEEMFKLKQNVCPENAGPQSSFLSHNHPPASLPSLFDLCSKLVSSRKLATLEEVQQCLIKDGRRRLERMESYGMERMLSISHDRPSSELDDFQDLNIQSAASSGSLSSSSSCSDMLADVVVPETVLSGGVEEEEESAGSGVELESGQAKSSDKDGYIVVPVDANLVQVLESLFGPAECRRGADAEFEVSLDLHTAKLIHSRLRRKKNNKSVLKQLKEDEALARRLQQEEKFGCVNQHYPISGLVIDVEPLHKRGGVGTVHHSKKEEPVKLKDIMKEEKDKHILRIEQQRLLEESGEHIAIATKLKRQKLYSIFPGVDENFLEEIFQANGFSLEDTVCVIQNCLGAKEKVKCVMTEDAMAEFDDKVLQQTKHLSMQTLMDSSSKAQSPSKDFQDVPGETDPLPSYSELRAEGTLHYQLRNDCFRKAQHAHQRGMNDVAYFYSQQGNLHTKKLKEAHMRASQKLLESRNHLLEQQSTLDLHGFHVGEAISTLQNILERREIEFQLRPDRHRQSLVIVTGRGRHSQGGVPKVRPAVANFLNNAKYRYTEDQVGIFKVQLRYRSTVK